MPVSEASECRINRIWVNKDCDIRLHSTVSSSRLQKGLEVLCPFRSLGQVETGTVILEPSLCLFTHRCIIFYFVMEKLVKYWLG